VLSDERELVSEIDDQTYRGRELAHMDQRQPPHWQERLMAAVDLESDFLGRSLAPRRLTGCYLIAELQGYKDTPCRERAPMESGSITLKMSGPQSLPLYPSGLRDTHDNTR
jgi:hypothetical protein